MDFAGLRAEEDWRLHATAYFAQPWTSPWSGHKSETGDRITVSEQVRLTKKKLVTIPRPNATALLLNAAARAYQSAIAIRSENGIDQPLSYETAFKTDAAAFDYLERMIEAVILSFTALEAFVNEAIPDDYLYAYFKRSETVLDVADKKGIERHICIDEKLTAVLPEIYSCKSPKESNVWQPYRTLKNARDTIIHMKSDERKSSGPNMKTVWAKLFHIESPHITIRNLIGFYVSNLEEKPGWYQKCPF